MSLYVSDQVNFHMKNHGTEFCLEQHEEELDKDYQIAEIIHFLHFHRWWDKYLISKHIQQEEPFEYDKATFVQHALRRKYKCHPTLHRSLE